MNDLFEHELLWATNLEKTTSCEHFDLTCYNAVKTAIATDATSKASNPTTFEPTRLKEVTATYKKSSDDDKQWHYFEVTLDRYTSRT
jgi:hypothetical protein